MLDITNLSVNVDNKKIINNLNLAFGTGVHVLMGSNGVGKSSLAHAIMGNPDYDVTGSVKMDGTELLDFETFERAQQGVFLSFQSPTPIKGLSNFQFIRQCKKQSSDDMTAITSSLLKFKQAAKEFRLDKEWDKKQLNVEASGGEKKKNEIIQMLLLEPKVAILDEPDSGLDIDSINTLAKMIKQFAQDDPTRTIIVITHYEKLITSLDPDTVTVIGKNRTVTEQGIVLAERIFEEGFAQYE